MDHRVLAQLQHTIQYPSAHLDRRVAMVAPCAVGGPVFEMGASTGPDEPIDHTDAHDLQMADTVDYSSPQLVAPGQPADRPITATDACKRFVLAGKAIFTLQGKDSRYTFRVNRAEPKPGYTNHAYFVSLLTGPDNLSDYTYVGLLMEHSGEVRITRSSKYRPDSQPVRAFNWAMSRIWRGLPIDPAVFYHIGRCARCGRALTVPSSVESGLGPECAGKLDGGI